jgi:hypothetical protein
MSSGYLLATRYEVLYQRALDSHTYDNNPIGKPIYGIPFSAPLTPPEKKYRGIDREPLQALTYDVAKLFTEAGTPSEANAATNLLEAIEIRAGRDDGWVTSLTDILEVWKLLSSEQSDYEIIWAKEFEDTTPVPGNCRFLGCDAAYFAADHFSCICDALFFPRWHGTDPEGVLFRRYYDLLNQNGLFDSNELALGYLQYYLSFDWTERADNFTSIEIYTVEVPKI